MVVFVSESGNLPHISDPENKGFIGPIIEGVANDLKNQIEITRFKGLGEINASEFRNFIGKDMRLTPIHINPSEGQIADILRFYMGSNTPKRQEFIINNLRVEQDDVL